MKRGDHVALVRNPSWTGRVTTVSGGMVGVTGDDGWTGTVPVEELTPVEDKSWPPSGIETKHG